MPATHRSNHARYHTPAQKSTANGFELKPYIKNQARFSKRNKKEEIPFKLSKHREF